MKAQGDDSKTRLQIERVLPASVEEVFRAWTDPESMASWLSPTGRAEVEADVRVGGLFRVVMLGEEMSIEHTGEYLELDPPTRLSFTWRSPYTGPGPSVVTVLLTRDGHRILLTLLHEQLPPEALDSHGHGWGSIIERLGSFLVGATAHAES